MSDVYQTPHSDVQIPSKNDGEYGSLEKGLAGDYDLRLGEILGEAWQKVRGMKLIVFVALVVYYIIAILSSVIGGAIAGFIGITTGEIMGGLIQFVVQIGSMFVLYPIFMGIMMMGVKRSVGAPVQLGMIFEYFSQAVPLFLTGILVLIATLIGLAFFIIPGIYLAISYSLAMILVIDKGLSPWQAMEASRKAVTRQWGSYFLVMFVVGLIVIASVIPFGIPLLWTFPLSLIAMGIMYRNIFGVTSIEA